MSSLKKVAIVVGEASGDILGAGLMAALKKRYPDCEFEGIGGPKMLALGFNSLFQMDRLAVMGFVEPLKRLPELLGIRKTLRERYLANPPDVFIGIDAPDFNLSLEVNLKAAGVPVVHYVSPSVWAWRKGRLKKIAKAVDLMLTLFPFEASFYKEQNIPNLFVGHPLADSIPLISEKGEARRRLGLSLGGTEKAERWVALLPGSRSGEVEHLCERFLLAAQKSYQSRPDLRFVIPAASEARYAQIKQVLKEFPDLPVTVVLGQSHDAMVAADAILIASGTATLEAMLLKRPMVIAYHMAAFSYWLLSKLVSSKFVGLPNLLADKELVPELLQQNATPSQLSDALNVYLDSNATAQQLINQFTIIHKQLRRDASETAAQGILSMLATHAGATKTKKSVADK